MSKTEHMLFGGALIVVAAIVVWKLYNTQPVQIPQHPQDESEATPTPENGVPSPADSPYVAPPSYFTSNVPTFGNFGAPDNGSSNISEAQLSYLLEPSTDGELQNLALVGLPDSAYIN